MCFSEHRAKRLSASPHRFSDLGETAAPRSQNQAAHLRLRTPVGARGHYLETLRPATAAAAARSQLDRPPDITMPFSVTTESSPLTGFFVVHRHADAHSLRAS